LRSASARKRRPAPATGIAGVLSLTPRRVGRRVRLEQLILIKPLTGGRDRTDTDP
jgi:hypothetical protein